MSAEPNRYGFTARHIRCDHCLRDYLPQHVHRVARWGWWCDNCIMADDHVGWPMEPQARRRWHHDRLAAR